MPAAARPPESRGSSSTKLKPASKGTAEAALQAAERAFSTPKPLPLNEDTLAHAKAIEGRQRLTGAFLIDLDRIRPDPTQPRKAFDTKADFELTASIEKIGLLQPITVRYLNGEDVYQIISGERRFQAAKALGWASLPCWVRTPKTDEILVHQVVENWQRADLHPFDLADALAALRDAGPYTQKQLAGLTGKPESEISKILSLLKLNPALQQQCRQDKSGEVSRRHLQALAHLPDADQARTLAIIKEQHLTAKQTERLVHESVARDEGRKRQGAPIATIRRFKTAHATVTFAFRKGEVTRDDLLLALDEARGQIEQDHQP